MTNWMNPKKKIVPIEKLVMYLGIKGNFEVVREVASPLQIQ